MSDPVGCGWLDFTAPSSFGGQPGVDNQLGPLLAMLASEVGADPRTLLDDAVFGRTLRLGVRLGDVEDLDTDGRVLVTLVDYRTGSVIGEWPDATIDGGRLRTNALAEPAVLRVPLGSALGVLTVRSSALTASVTSRGLRDGVLGGIVGVEDLVTALVAASTSGQAETYRSVAAAQADIDLDGDASACEGLSIALTFSALLAGQ